MKFYAESLEEIAAHCEEVAGRWKKIADNHPPKHLKHKLALREAETWVNVAAMLRMTELVKPKQMKKVPFPTS